MQLRCSGVADPQHARPDLQGVLRGREGAAPVNPARSDAVAPNGNPHDIERRLIVARALASEHGAPLGFHDEEDQLYWDRKACAVLRELDALDA